MPVGDKDRGQKARNDNDALTSETAGDEKGGDDDGYRRGSFTHAEHASRAADGTFLFHGHAVPGI